MKEKTDQETEINAHLGGRQVLELVQRLVKRSEHICMTTTKRSIR